MKNAAYIILVWLPFVLLCCKKPDSCDNVSCGPNGTCLEGVCNCNLQTQHSENGVCVCNGKWLGDSCNLPAPTLGKYHIVGTYSGSYFMGNSFSNPIDTFATLERIDSVTLRFRGNNLKYYNSGTDSIYFTFMVTDNFRNFKDLHFHRSLNDDSLFYRSHSGTIASDFETDLVGVKVN